MRTMARIILLVVGLLAIPVAGWAQALGTVAGVVKMRPGPWCPASPSKRRARPSSRRSELRRPTARASTDREPAARACTP